MTKAFPKLGVDSMIFEAGIAVRDITPRPGVPMWGYSDRAGPATGALDSLYARALVLRVGDQCAAIVSLDLGRPPAQASRARIVSKAAEAGVDFVMLCATHTHHGPVMEYPDEPHAVAIECAIHEAIDEAATSCAPARIGSGNADFDIAHNRRHNTRDGRCVMVWRNEERRQRGTIDREATIIKIDHLDGSPLATIVHFACHPVIMGPSNLQYSADYPGEMTRLVKERTGGECIFLQGGCGDINPFLDKTPTDEDAIDAMRAVGRECAEAVLSVIDRIPTAATTEPTITFREDDVEVGTRWNLEDPAAREAFIVANGGVSDLVRRYDGCMRADLKVPVSTLLINRSIALIGMPGEFFVQHQLALKHMAPAHTTLLCGYTNEYHLYFPPIRDAIYGGYGGTVGSYVGIGAADKLVLRSQHAMVELLGKNRDACTKEDFIIHDSNSKPKPLVKRIIRRLQS